MSHATEDGADELLDAAVMAVRQRLDAAERQLPRIAWRSGEGCLCVLAGTRWSVSAANASGVDTGRGGRSQRRGQRIGDPYAHSHGRRTVWGSFLGED